MKIDKSVFTPEELAQYEALIAKAKVDPEADPEEAGLTDGELSTPPKKKPQENPEGDGPREGPRGQCRQEGHLPRDERRAEAAGDPGEVHSDEGIYRDCHEVRPPG